MYTIRKRWLNHSQLMTKIFVQRYLQFFILKMLKIQTSSEAQKQSEFIYISNIYLQY